LFSWASSCAFQVFNHVASLLYVVSAPGLGHRRLWFFIFSMTLLYCSSACSEDFSGAGVAHEGAGGGRSGG
jgi:hypothetical protein